MSEEKPGDLAQRIDGVARVLMMLIADLERREQLDGKLFCENVRALAFARDQFPVSAEVMKEIAGQIDDARLTRDSRERLH